MFETIPLIVIVFTEFLKVARYFSFFSRSYAVKIVLPVAR